MAFEMNSIRNNSFYSLLGFVIPTLIMLVAYPLMVRSLGAEAFGVFVLATSISGVLAFLDFGFAAATLKYVAEDLSNQDHKGAADIILASVIFYTGMGLIVALGIWVFSPRLAKVFSVSAILQSDAVLVFRLAAIQFAVSMLGSIALSIFKGMHRFDRSSLMLSALSVLTYGTSIIAILVWNVGLVGVTAIGLFVNIIIFFFAGMMALTLCRDAGINLSRANVSYATFRRMYGFGSAMAVSSIASVLHAQFQKILIGAVIGPQYVTSFFIGVWGPAKVNAATLAFSEPLFPKISALQDDICNHKLLYRKYFFIIFLIASISLLPFLFFSTAIYNLWFGGNPPEYVSEIATIMAVSLFLNSISQPAHHLLNGIGRPWVNTFFTIISPVILYSILLVLYLLHGHLDLLDFAWATAFSLGVTSVVYLLWVERQLSP